MGPEPRNRNLSVPSEVKGSPPPRSLSSIRASADSVRLSANPQKGEKVAAITIAPTISLSPPKEGSSAVVEPAAVKAKKKKLTKKTRTKKRCGTKPQSTFFVSKAKLLRRPSSRGIRRKLKTKPSKSPKPQWK